MTILDLSGKHWNLVFSYPSVYHANLQHLNSVANTEFQYILLTRGLSNMFTRKFNRTQRNTSFELYITLIAFFFYFYASSMFIVISIFYNTIHIYAILAQKLLFSFNQGAEKNNIFFSAPWFQQWLLKFRVSISHCHKSPRQA